MMRLLKLDAPPAPSFSRMAVNRCRQDPCDFQLQSTKAAHEKEFIEAITKA